MAKVNEIFKELNGTQTDPRVRRYITPKRIIFTQGNVTNPEVLLNECPNQLTFHPAGVCGMQNNGDKNAAIRIDFGI